MMLQWAQQELVHLVWAAIAFTAALAIFERRGRGALGRLVSSAMQQRLTNQSSIGRRRLRLFLVFGCQCCAILALMRPQTPGGLETSSASKNAADIVVALDVSRSMLADDAAPTRLDRAKAEVFSLVDRLDGHRIGLVAFAGRATVLAPLTPDYGFFRMILRGTNTDSISRGGTRIGDAVRTATRIFERGPGSKILVLITDGEDHDSFPDDAAAKAKEADIRIISIGFGSEEGSKITLVDPKTGARSLLEDRSGSPVISKLDGELLRRLALTTEGAYVPAGVATLDLESIIAEHIEPIVRVVSEERRRRAPNEHYSWFLFAALIGLFGATLCSRPGGTR